MSKNIAIIGGGPAGLMAAHTLLSGDCDNHTITLYDAMPSVGRKLLMAGKSGLNFTHNEPMNEFKKRYSNGDPTMLQNALDDFTNQDAIDLFNHYDIETFIGSTGRLFPKGMKASPFLRAWLKDLTSKGLEIKTRHKMIGLDGKTVTFQSVDEEFIQTFDAVILACGGASWSRLGSDGKWAGMIEGTKPFEPSNCGFKVNWSDKFIELYAGSPVKNTRITAGSNYTSTGEYVITQTGIEGGGIYTISRDLRDSLTLIIDLAPNKSKDALIKILTAPRGKNSLSNILRKKCKISGVKAGLLRECLSKKDVQDPEKLASAIKACVIECVGPQPIDQAISTTGGLDMGSLNKHWMLQSHEGLFAAGEMLNWDAPTGGYLITACFATGKAAAEGVRQYLKGQHK